MMTSTKVGFLPIPEAKALKIANRILDSLGYIRGHFGLPTDPGIMTIVDNMLRLVPSISEIKLVEDTASAEKKDEHVIKMIELERKAEFLKQV